MVPHSPSRQLTARANLSTTRRLVNQSGFMAGTEIMPIMAVTKVNPIRALSEAEAKLLRQHMKKGSVKIDVQALKLAPCAHERNEKEYIGQCGQCGGPTPYCTKCNKPFCEWCS